MRFTGMAPGKLRDRLPQHFPDLMLLAHAQIALLPALANFELNSLQDILEKHGQRYSQVVCLQEISAPLPVPPAGVRRPGAGSALPGGLLRA